MSPDRSEVLIVTTAHWSGDPRLNRHVEYLRRDGIQARLSTFDEAVSTSRFRKLGRALAEIWSTRPATVILPDPELFVLGSLVARLARSRAVIDVHENYPEAVASRDWLPEWSKPIVRVLAAINDRLGRVLSHETVVAAPELADDDGVVVSNIPDPTSLSPRPTTESSTVVYVGDVTEARGAIEIAELAREMPELEFIVIGRTADSLADKMMTIAGPKARLRLRGQLAHKEAWTVAQDAFAGLSLLQPMPAYLDAVATKLWEYCASGIPPIVTDLPGQRSFVSQIDPTLAVADVESARRVLGRLRREPAWAAQLAAKSRLLAQEAWENARPDLALSQAVSPDR